MTVIKTRGIVSPARSPVMAFFSALWIINIIVTRKLSSMQDRDNRVLKYCMIWFLLLTLFLMPPQDSQGLYICLPEECSSTFPSISERCNTCQKRTTSQKSTLQLQRKVCRRLPWRETSSAEMPQRGHKSVQLFVTDR